MGTFNNYILYRLANTTSGRKQGYAIGLFNAKKSFSAEKRIR